MTKIGSLTLFDGCLAAGKSALLLNRVAYLRSLKRVVSVCLHTSAHPDRLHAFSRAGAEAYALRFNDTAGLVRYVQPREVLAIDEAQVLGVEYAPILTQMLDKGIPIIAAGRDTDFRGEPFPIMEWLRSRATEHTRLTAVCTKCLGPATRSQRLIRNEPAAWDSPIREQGLPTETYESRCVEHHIVPGRPA